MWFVFVFICFYWSTFDWSRWRSRDYISTNQTVCERETNTPFQIHICGKTRHEWFCSLVPRWFDEFPYISLYNVKWPFCCIWGLKNIITLVGKAVTPEESFHPFSEVHFHKTWHGFAKSKAGYSFGVLFFVLGWLCNRGPWSNISPKNTADTLKFFKVKSHCNVTLTMVIISFQVACWRV